MRRFLFALVMCFGSFFAVRTTKANVVYSERQITVPKDSAIADSTDNTDDDKNRMFIFGLEYATDQAQHGLHNDIKIPYLEPSFTYMAPKGFYVELNSQYVLAKKVSGFDVFSINPGWDIDFGDNSTLNFNYTRYFFSGSAPNLIRSSLSNDLETYFSEWIGNLKAKIVVDYSIYKVKNKIQNSPNDICFTPDLMYKFKWKLGENSKLKLKPEASVDFGTRNFYTEYVNAKIADSTAKGEKPKVSKVASNSNSSFGILDYNLTLTADFAIGKFDIEPAFNYTDPLYKPSNVPNPPIAYFTLGITYTIYSK